MQILFFATVRELTKEKETHMSAPKTVGDMLLFLSNKYGKKFREKTLTEDNKIGHELIVLVNGRHVAHLNQEKTALCEQDIVSIFPVIGGG